MCFIQNILVLVGTILVFVVLLDPTLIRGRRMITQWLVFVLTLTLLNLWKLLSTWQHQKDKFKPSGELADESGLSRPLLTSNDHGGVLETENHIESLQSQDPEINATLTESLTNRQTSTIQESNSTSTTNDNVNEQSEQNVAEDNEIETMPGAHSPAECSCSSTHQPHILTIQECLGAPPTNGTEVCSSSSGPYGLKKLKKLSYFGSVWIGEYSTSNVTMKFAVKTLESDNFHDVMLEIGIVTRCSHPNIVTCFGYESCGPKFNILFELMTGGCLEKKLQEWKQSLDVLQAFNYMSQVTAGMAYLAQKGVIHRDLAAQNCLLSGDYTVVKFSEKSDVWAFGCLIWQIFSEGSTPFELMDLDRLKKFLFSGKRLDRPERCPLEVFDDIMMPCWRQNPAERPTFSEIREIIFLIEAEYREDMNYVVNRRRSF
ncbi:protein tyrosine kinase domain-containing protein [Ditylenchus destructor]|nr:protein tyrosine kinase domain-containing protein [Ditylenchus destructor]